MKSTLLCPRNKQPRSSRSLCPNLLSQETTQLAHTLHLTQRDFTLIIVPLYDNTSWRVSVCSQMHRNCEADAWCTALLGICNVYGPISEEVASPLLLRLGFVPSAPQSSLWSTLWGMCVVRDAPVVPSETDLAPTLGNQGQLEPLSTLFPSVSVKACSSPYGTFWAQGTLHGRIKAQLGFTYAH